MKMKPVREDQYCEIAIRTGDRAVLTQIIPDHGDTPSDARLGDVIEAAFDCIKAIGYAVPIGSRELTHAVLAIIAEHRQKAVH